MSKDFRKNEKRLVKSLCAMQEAIVLLAGNTRYANDFYRPPKLQYRYVVPTYIYSPCRYTGLTSLDAKPISVKIISRWENDYSVVNAKNIYTRYTDRVYSSNYLFLEKGLYLEDICKVTSFLTKLRTKNIKVKDIKPLYKELVEEMYKKYVLDRFTHVEESYEIDYYEEEVTNRKTKESITLKYDELIKKDEYIKTYTIAGYAVVCKKVLPHVKR